MPDSQAQQAADRHQNCCLALVCPQLWQVSPGRLAQQQRAGSEPGSSVRLSCWQPGRLLQRQVTAVTVAVQPCAQSSQAPRRGHTPKVGTCMAGASVASVLGQASAGLRSPLAVRHMIRFNNPAMRSILSSCFHCTAGSAWQRHIWNAVCPGLFRTPTSTVTATRLRFWELDLSYLHYPCSRVVLATHLCRGSLHQCCQQLRHLLNAGLQQGSRPAGSCHMAQQHGHQRLQPSRATDSPIRGLGH